MNTVVNFAALTTALTFLVASVGCYTATYPTIAENIGLIALSDDLSQASFARVIEAEECYWLAESPSPEWKAFNRLLSQAKEGRLRGLKNVSCYYERTVLFVPYLGGTSRCVKCRGDGYL